MKKKNGLFVRACVFLLTASLVCGGLYTLVVTGIGQLIFPHQANASVIEVDGKKYGCELMAQQFEDADHMWGRIMNIDTETFTDDSGNPVMYSWAANINPASDEYEQLVAERVEKIKAAHPGQENQPVPEDLVTCSGSGFDPEISPAAAQYQIPRIARNTGRSEEEVGQIVERYTTGRFLGIFGEPRVNVLKVNLALEGIL